MKCKSCGQEIIKTYLDVIVNREKQSISDALGGFCGDECPLVNYCPIKLNRKNKVCLMDLVGEWLEEKAK